MNDIGRRVVYRGEILECVESTSPGCEGCALREDERMCRSNPCRGGVYQPAEWVKPEGADEINRRYGGWMEAMPMAGLKPTNPKDAIGIRKVNMSCLPAGVMMDVALALMEGAAKYGRHNYRGVGVRSSVYYDAAMGHLMDWWEGDDIDSESGLSHVTKAIASLAVLRDAMLQNKLTDDRPPRSLVFKRDFNPMAEKILDRHADKTPKHWTLED